MRPAAALVACIVLGGGPALAVGPRPPGARGGVDTPLGAGARAPRMAAWAASLAPIEVASVYARTSSAPFLLYTPDGAVDDAARAAFERVASGDAEPHSLALRVEQLLVKAAYHFKRTRVVLLSAWRANAGRHGTGEAVDFKVDGVRAATLAAYLRGLPRAGVGVYTHPRTQFVHLDVRGESYHWIDASPPGVHWREWQLRDPRARQRDAAWSPEQDLPRGD